MVRRAVFFDRDGVLNYLVNHDGVMTAPWSFDEFEFMTGVEEAVNLIRKLDYLTFVVTNQPDVLDDKLNSMDLKMMMLMCIKHLGIDDGLVAYERGSAWYKPNNGMIETLIKSYKIDRGSSYIIGDRWKDIVAGHKSKLNTIYVGEVPYQSPEKYQHIQPDYIADNTLHACTLISELTRDD
jgi:HAD superfamily hydrolase (TIGR01662 family)